MILLLSDEFKRFWASFEITAALFLYFFTLWAIAPHAGELWANLTFLAIMVFAFIYVLALSPAIHRDTLAQRGLGNWKSCFIRVDNLPKATVQFGILTIIGSSVLVMKVLWLDSQSLFSINWLAFRDRFLFYLPFALIQDFFFYGFIFQRVVTIIPRPAPQEMSSGVSGPPERNMVRYRWATAIVMAIIFSVCHVPNSTMMLICFVAGFFWTFIFSLTPNITMVVLSHAFLGSILSRVNCLYTRVGPFYANNDRYVFMTIFNDVKEWCAGFVRIAMQ